jgi:hypothetical protein
MKKLDVIKTGAIMQINESKTLPAVRFYSHQLRISRAVRREKLVPPSK